MYFEKTLGVSKIPEDAKIMRREAVRGVALDGDSIFMVHTSNGDYKFPGGGIEEWETHAEALKREFIEETGCSISDEMKFIGVITEQKFEENAYFVMKSYYYECKVEEKKQEQQLEPYEKRLNFKAELIPVVNAYKNNLLLVEKFGSIASSPWLGRETIALEYIVNNLKGRHKCEN